MSLDPKTTPTYSWKTIEIIFVYTTKAKASPNE
jgi:hypothetical protein